MGSERHLGHGSRREGAPFTLYTIEAIKDLDAYPAMPVAPGNAVDAFWFGRTANGTTMTPVRISDALCGGGVHLLPLCGD